MVFRTFNGDGISRRGLLRGAAWAGASAALTSLPLGRAALAQSGSWPNVAKAGADYVASGKVANMVSAMGWGQAAPEIIAHGTLAFDNARPVDMDSLYRIYSMTKPVTGMATMMLIDDGRLGLDQPLAEILPAFSNMQVQKEYDGSIGPENLEPAARPITIRQLLTHTAGIGYTITQKGPIREAYEENGLIAGQVSRFPIPGLGNANPVDSLTKFADRLAKLPLVYQPGIRWSYSASIDLLGRVIEVASGMPFDVFLAKRIFEPAGMDSTWFQVPESEAARLTTNYGIWNGNTVPIDPGAGSIFLDPPPLPLGGAGLVSSPRDYDRFQRILVGFGKIDDKRIMGELAVRVGTSNLLSDDVELRGSWVEGNGFGAGGRVTGTSYGWGGAAGTTAFVDMESGLRAGNFTQYTPAEAYPIQRQFPEIVGKDLLEMRGG